MTKHVCIHGHFYQPPRENPWLDRIERQDSAHPFHDWNARIDAECYGPNGRARILDDTEHVLAIVNNYAKISFNMGPTLLSWLKLASPRSYASILEADALSIKALGHGSAMAQVYNHMIMPLASERDRETQVKWGMADFAHRFGRKAEGMWLAETAVCTATLRALAREGVLFTVLAPRQAEALRRIGDVAWTTVERSLDTTMPYRVDLGDGLSIAVFFYDGPLSQAVAFERLLSNGGQFADRLLSGHAPRKDVDHLIHIATDGESYGHHHRFGEMALAYALDKLDKQKDVKLTNYATFLAAFPPTHEARIVERSAWSCAHGVGRWERDCGCSMRGDSSQAWRKPLRDALDWLRDRVDAATDVMTALVPEPHDARNRYIEVILRRTEQAALQFLETESRATSAAERTRVLVAMEMQHARMLMYTSCGWFFDDVDGLEPTQILRYAARVCGLYEELTGTSIEEAFVAELAKHEPARGAKTAAEVYRFAASSKIDEAGFASTFAIASMFGRAPKSSATLSLIDREALSAHREEKRFVEGAVTVRDDVLLRSKRFHFAAFSEGTSQVKAGLREDGPWTTASALFHDDDVTGLADLLRDAPIHVASLGSLPLDDRALVVEEILRDAVREAEATYREVFTKNAVILGELSAIGVRMPRALGAASRVILEADLMRALRRDPPDARTTRNLLAEASSENVRIDLEAVAYELTRALARTVARLEKNPLEDSEVGRVGDLLAIARRFGNAVDVAPTQDLTWAIANEPNSALGRRVREGGRLGAWRELAKLVRIRIESAQT